MHTLVPKNLCAIILSTIYLSPKNLGRKFELIWATENLGTNSSKNERFSTKISVRYLPQFIIIPYYSSHFAFNCKHYQKTKISNIISLGYEEKAIFLQISGPQAKCQKFGQQKIQQTEKIYAINLVCKKFGREARSNFLSPKFLGIKVLGLSKV